MNPPNHVARWVAAGMSVLALAGAGTVVATTEPPDTTTAGDDTSMSSEASVGAGPSACPSITSDAEGTEETEAAAGSDAAEATDAMVTETTGAMDTTLETTGDSVAVDLSAPPDVSGPAVQIVETDEYGPILVDGACYTLYAFSNDVDGEPTCVDDCSTNWPPALVDGEVPPLADELDPTLFSVVEHPDGPMLKIGDWPLYYFAGDTAPGELNGQGVGGVWWVVSPDGTLIDTEEAAEETEAAEATDSGDTVTETTEY